MNGEKAKGRSEDKMLKSNNITIKQIIDVFSCRYEGDDLEPSHEFHGVRPSISHMFKLHLYLLLLVYQIIFKMRLSKGQLVSIPPYEYEGPATIVI